MKFVRLCLGPIGTAQSRLGTGQVLILALLVLAGCSSDSSPDWADIKGEAGPAKLVEFTQSARFEQR